MSTVCLHLILFTSLIWTSAVYLHLYIRHLATSFVDIDTKVDLIDYDVNYEEGNEFKKLRNIPTVEECRQKCLEESQCKYYVWRGSTRRKQCLLKSSSLWIPKYEEGTVSGTKFQLFVYKNFWDFSCLFTLRRRISAICLHRSNVFQLFVYI